MIFKFVTKLPVFNEHVHIKKPDETFYMEKKPMQCYEKENTSVTTNN